jgi:hypothetical protein
MLEEQRRQLKQRDISQVWIARSDELYQISQVLYVNPKN